jgi:hypothetical protein
MVKAKSRPAGGSFVNDGRAPVGLGGPFAVSPMPSQRATRAFMQRTAVAQPQPSAGLSRRTGRANLARGVCTSSS